jgi:outer membrane lipoprotein-sorting protein
VRSHFSVPRPLGRLRFPLTLAAAFLALASLPSAGDPGAALLAKVDSLLAFDKDLCAEYAITQRSAAGAESKTVAVGYRRDRSEQYLMVILEPSADKGKGYLKSADNLWVYDPADGSFVFTSAKERFRNTTARNSDFARSSLARDYAVQSSSKGKLASYDCDILTLKAKNDSVTFPMVKVWISQDGLPRLYEDYSLSGTLMRTVAVPDYASLGGRYVAAKTVIQDNLKSMTVDGKTRYEQATILMSNPSLRDLPDSYYSKEYLERVSRK